MALTTQERIKDLRVKRKLKLKDVAGTRLSSSALGSYELNETKDITHRAIIELATEIEIAPHQRLHKRSGSTILKCEQHYRSAAAGR